MWPFNLVPGQLGYLSHLANDLGLGTKCFRIRSGEQSTKLESKATRQTGRPNKILTCGDDISTCPEKPFNNTNH